MSITPIFMIVTFYFVSVLVSEEMFAEGVSCCSLTICAKVPLCANSSSGVPCSTTVPPERTTMLSAPNTVRMRCAMMMTVLLRTSSEIPA